MLQCFIYGPLLWSTMCVYANDAKSPLVAEQEKQISAEYASLTKHYKQMDFMAFVTCTTSDVRLYQIIGGRLTRDALADRMHRLETEVKSVESVRFTITKMTYREKEKDAIVNVTQTSSFTRRDPNADFGPPGQVHTISNTIVSRDVWVKHGSNWKMKLSEQISHKRSIDGTPHNPVPAPVHPD
jgi:hypothetical protein